MDKSDNNEDKKASKSFDHIRDWMRETKQRLKQVDDQIKVVPPDRGPDLALHPPGFVRSRQFGSRDQRVADLKDYQTQLKADRLKSIENEVKGADPKTARSIKDNYREELYPNPYKKMSAAQKAAHQKVSRDIEQSQDFMASKLTVQSEPELKEETPKPEKSERTFQSMSMRFSQSLSYQRVPEKSDGTPKKDAGKDRD